jgi:two-component system NtrC family sensor kinase
MRYAESVVTEGTRLSTTSAGAVSVTEGMQVMLGQATSYAVSMTGIGQGTLGIARRVLVIEDDSAIRTAVCELLEEEGFEVSTCEQGQAALQTLRDGRPLPDLIILDLMMPVMDGWDFRVKQRTDPALADIPVVAISADGSPKARAIHADAYLSKPFSAEELLLRIDQILRGREEQQIRERLGHTQRLAALGTLAVGVGHEINNALGAVTANVELANQALPRMQRAVRVVKSNPMHQQAGEALDSLTTGLDRLRETTHDALAGALRMQDIASSLRAFAHVPARPTHRIDLRTVIMDALKLAAGHIGGRANVTFESEPAAVVLGDAGQLAQVLVNLLVNAVQAFPGPSSSLAENRVRVWLHEDPRGVVVEVADNGPGIPASMQKRLFEPFFTTKPSGEGTGLGLFISRSIVESHAGTITVASEPGHGTTFSLILPAAPSAPNLATVPAASPTEIQPTDAAARGAGPDRDRRDRAPDRGDRDQ